MVYRLNWRLNNLFIYYIYFIYSLRRPKKNEIKEYKIQSKYKHKNTKNLESGNIYKDLKYLFLKSK